MVTGKVAAAETNAEIAERDESLGQHLMRRPPKYVHGFIDRHRQTAILFPPAGWDLTKCRCPDCRGHQNL